MREQLNQFLLENNIEPTDIEVLPLSGGDRIYFRVKNNGATCIATYSEDVRENRTFFSFSKALANLGIPVPQLIAIHTDATMYVQQDLGNECLLDCIEARGFTDENFELYKKCIEQLAKLNIEADKKIDYSLCLVNQQFDHKAALYDLHYCQKYFVDAMQIKYDNTLLQQEFKQLSTEIGNISPSYFMYRDCQGRNIMVQDNEIYFIDYQGGMRGPLGYDVASLLWQAKAQLPAVWKQALLKIYLKEANRYLPNDLDETLFIQNYYKIVLMRLLQVLGAYGRRGLLEGKAHFLSSIPQGINNLQQWMLLIDISTTYPTIYTLLNSMIATKQK
jgi:aminoglycoside/choline kinase family phosphotransferase